MLERISGGAFVSAPGYTMSLFDPKEQQERMDKAFGILSKVEFDAIAMRGASGMLFGAPLAFLMNKGMILVRKPEELNHSYRTVEGLASGKKYIIVDDLVSTGATVRIMKEAILAHADFSHYEFVGDYLYNSGRFHPHMSRDSVRIPAGSIAIDRRILDGEITTTYEKSDGSTFTVREGGPTYKANSMPAIQNLPYPTAMMERLSGGLIGKHRIDAMPLRKISVDIETKQE